MEYIIVGDSKEFDGCLIYVCGKSKVAAEQLLSNPTDEQKRRLNNYSNVCIKEVEDKHCWWNQGGLD